MLTQSQVDMFQKKGFLLGNRVLPDDEVEELRSELARVIDQYENPDVKQPVRIANLGGKEESPVWQIVNIWEASPAFHKLIYNPTVVEEIGQLTSSIELRVWHDQIQYKPPQIGGVNRWHQDSPLWGILMPKTSQVTAWVALDDVDESNGCMRMVPGSYQWGSQMEFLRTLPDIHTMPDQYNDNDLSVELCPVSKGHVHYHHSLTWHGSHDNTSDAARRAIAVHYMTSETIYDESGNHLMKPFVTVNNGDKLAGDHFPLVMESGKPTNVVS
ncbi:phytanoyl-CoA dioxygenase family protein [Candidatus Poribacteria bacterium]|nr:MAG: phytanoyl-CoA dioxygenase family protein [Candidatus Poribacteria bacterium]